MSRVEEIIQLLTSAEPRQGSRVVAASIVEEYRQLSMLEGRELARFALTILDSAGEQQVAADLGERMLLHLACLVPGALDGLHAKLLTREIVYPPELFRGADAQTRDQLLAWLNGDAELAFSVSGDHLLKALACIEDETVQAVFRQWQQTPPEWRSALYIPPEAYAHEAGWHLMAQGEYRRLFFDTCYELMRRDLTQDAESVSPVRAILPHEDVCLWCGLHLQTLFNFDLQDPRLAFLHLSGAQLRVAFCRRCSTFGYVFTEVDMQGGSRWSKLNHKPDFIGHEDSAWNLPQDTLVLNRLRRSPYEAHQFVMYDVPGASQVGGHPMWIQDAEYPACPRCQEPMPFLAQLQTGEIDAMADGVMYAFLCVACMLATTSYQGT